MKIYGDNGELIELPSGGSTDVQVAGTSITSDGVANIKGVGWRLSSDGDIEFVNNSAYIGARTNNAYKNYVLTNSFIDHAVRLAMTDGKGADWTDDEKASARSRMGVPDDRFFEPLTIDEETGQIVVTMTPAEIYDAIQGGKIAIFLGAIFTLLSSSLDVNGSAIEVTLVESNYGWKLTINDSGLEDFGSWFPSRIISGEEDADELNIVAGQEWGDGAWLALRKADREEKAGTFELYAFGDDGESFVSLYGASDGSLKWDDKQLALAEDVPTDDHINSLIDAKLGVILNGTY